MFRRSTPSFESASMEHLVLERAHERAEDVLAERIQESDFVGVYREKEIEADKEEVARRKLRAEKGQTKEKEELKKTADVFEAIVLEQGELSKWFGEYGYTIGASEYDDWINGIDLLVEFRQPNLPEAPLLALGIDVTFSIDVTDKFDRVRKQIEDGSLAKIKYFSSEHSTEKGPRDNLPEVIVGVSAKTVNELQELWLGRDQMAIEQHRIQIMILMEIKEQLLTFIEYSCSLNDKRLAGIFENRLEIVEKLLGKKNDIYLKVANELEGDPVFRAITEYMREWRRIIKKSQEKQKQIEETEENKPLTLKESAEVQRGLVVASRLQLSDWIPRYGVKFRRMVDGDPTIREMVRNDREGALREITRRLYGGETKSAV
ncbi:MAG: hypothetical protein AAB690_00590 [Patescibacteria group bacterium]